MTNLLVSHQQKLKIMMKMNNYLLMILTLTVEMHRIIRAVRVALRIQKMMMKMRTILIKSAWKLSKRNSTSKS